MVHLLLVKEEGGGAGSDNGVFNSGANRAAAFSPWMSRLEWIITWCLGELGLESFLNEAAGH